MPLGVYFDESGTNPNDPALTIAGFISDEERWAAFSEKWKAVVVDTWGLRYFHMADFEARQDQFKNWPRDEESKRRLDYLLTLIADHVLGLVSVSFPRDLFHAYFSPKPKKVERLYMMTAASALLEASIFPREQAPSQKMAVVFETGARGRHQVQQAYDSLPPGTAEHLNFLSLTFGTKQEYEPLQAADILAYETFRHFPKVYGNETRPVRYPLKKILDTVPQAWGVVDQAYLDDIGRML
jgi:hypothetical protein